MSILIKGMEMPRSCAECYVAWERCHRTVEWYKNNPQYYDIRHEDCPLVPVPPHGDLIDAQEQMRLMQSYEYDTYEDYRRAFDVLDNAPTIIEAEEEDR